MREERYGRERVNNGKRRRIRRKKIVHGAMIVILCIITFLGGRVSAEVKANQDDKPRQGQDYTISSMVDIEAEPADRGPAEPEADKTETSKPETENPENAEAEPQADREADTDAWNLILVNSSHPIPDNFSVDLVQLKNGQAIDKRAYPDLQDMMDDARAAGLEPYICSSYRTGEKQTSLYNRQVEKYLAQGYPESDAKAEAGRWVAVPGTSEHQLGLAVDIVSKNYQILDKKQESTPEQQWLMENCHKYGFILRYPGDKSGITGIGYEPWHYRYVGKKAAAEIMEKGICLEEYAAAGIPL